MRNYNDPARFEKEMTNEPEKLGEFSPSLENEQDGWESLKDVPFRGDTVSQEQCEEIEQEM